MAIDDAVRDFAAAMAVIADRAPAGAIVTTTHVWRVGRGKLHVDEDCAGLGDSVPRPVTVNLATTGAHRLCGKCWTHLPAGARRVQAAVTALDTAAQGLAAAERALASGDPRRLAVSAAWGLRRYAARARGYARDETQYNPALRAWATTIVAAAEELVPRAEALLAADPGREVRLAALALMDPPVLGRSGRPRRNAAPPGDAATAAPALTGAGHFPTGQDGLLRIAWTAWRNAIGGGDDDATASSAALTAAGIGEREPQLLSQVPDVPVAAGTGLRDAAVTAWRVAAEAELRGVCGRWADQFAELAGDLRPTLAAWTVEGGWGKSARMLLARADVTQSGQVALAVLPAVCAELLARDGIAEDASGDVQLGTLHGDVPGPVVAAAAQLWADNAGRKTPLDDPRRALRVAAATHGLPDPTTAPAPLP